jgi:RpiR family transcriptional regulator, carbohydrate utilization regulator
MLAMIIGLIEQNKLDLRPSERRVADYVIGRPSVVVQMSIADLSEQAQVSEPTIMRFCRAIGCVGFMDFKRSLARDLERRTLQLNRNNPASSPHADLGSALFTKVIAGVKAIEPDGLAGLEDLLELCAGAGEIVILCRTEEAAVGVLLADQMNKAGLQARVETGIVDDDALGTALLIALKSSHSDPRHNGLANRIQQAGGRVAVLGQHFEGVAVSIATDHDTLAGQLSYLALLEAFRLGIEARIGQSGLHRGEASHILQAQRETAYADARRRDRQTALVEEGAPHGG